MSRAEDDAALEEDANDLMEEILIEEGTTLAVIGSDWLKGRLDAAREEGYQEGLNIGLQIGREEARGLDA